MSIPVLHEDNHLLVVTKPPGIPSQGDVSGDMDLLTLLKADLKQRHRKPGDVFLGLVHRLDRPTGGVMVFARTSKGASRLSDQIRRNLMTKHYLAVLDGEPPPDGELTDHLLKDREANHVSVVPAHTEGAKAATLSFRTLAQRNGKALVLIRLYTGRSHQIRVQFASRQAPLCGDRRYGNGNAKDDLALWAYRLCFTHPTTKDMLVFESAPPASGIWMDFADPLSASLSGLDEQA